MIGGKIMVSKRQLTNILENTPVIPAIKNEQGLKKVIETDNKTQIIHKRIIGYNFFVNR